VDKDFIQNLRYKLQKRVRRVNSSGLQIFHCVLKQFWGFLLEQPLLMGILENLEIKSEKVAGEVEEIFANSKAIIFDTEEKMLSQHIY